MHIYILYHLINFCNTGLQRIQHALLFFKKIRNVPGKKKKLIDQRSVLQPYQLPNQMILKIQLLSLLLHLYIL